MLLLFLFNNNESKVPKFGFPIMRFDFILLYVINYYTARVVEAKAGGD